jgi:hypothetical protein
LPVGEERLLLRSRPLPPGTAKKRQALSDVPTLGGLKRLLAQPSRSCLLIPPYREDGLRLGEVAHLAHVSKQTLTTMIRLLDATDSSDGRYANQDLLRPKIPLVHTREKAPLAELTAA